MKILDSHTDQRDCLLQFQSNSTDIVSPIFYKTDFNKWFGKLHSTVFYFDLLSLMLVYVAHAMLQKIKINKNCSQEPAVEFRH